MASAIEKVNSRDAFAIGVEFSSLFPDGVDRDAAFTIYRQICNEGRIAPSVSASVCFVKGYLGKAFPAHDSRVIS